MTKIISKKYGNYYELIHGRTIHGIQYENPELKSIATAYYSTNSGIGLTIKNHPKLLKSKKGLKMGVIGLGIGTLACYDKEVSEIRFYEINPIVVSLAEGYGSYFRNLKNLIVKMQMRKRFFKFTILKKTLKIF